MKNVKIIISVLLAVSLLAAVFTACKGSGDKKSKTVTEVVAVTDENGEEVTDENGEVVTTVITVDEDSTSSDSEGEVVVVDENGNEIDDGGNGSGNKGNKDKKKKDKKDKKDKKESDTTKKGKEPVTKPAAPDAPTGFKAGDVTKSSVTLSWNTVKCDGYEVASCTSGNNWETVKDSMTATKIKIEGLNTFTPYKFRVRAFNKNSAGKSASKWVEASAKTKADTDNNRFIKIKVKLPLDSNMDDKLVVTILPEGKKEAETVLEKDIKCNGKYITFTTEKKYKGLVTIKARVKKYDASCSITSDKDSVLLEIPKNGIDAEIDYEPF